MVIIVNSKKTKELRLGDIGTRFEILVYEEDEDTKEEVPVDVSSATVKDLKFEKPDGATRKVELLEVTDGKDGRLYWDTTVITDLDQEGSWIVQAYLEIDGPWKGHSDQESFTVGRIITVTS